MIKTRMKELHLLDSFWQHPKCPLHIVAHTKDGNIALILGESQSGKTFLLSRMRRFFQLRLPASLYSPNWDDATMSDDARFNSFKRVAPELHSFQINMLESCLAVAQDVSKDLHSHISHGTEALLLIDDPSKGLSHDHTCALARYYATRMRLADASGVDLVIATQSRIFAKIILDSVDKRTLSIIMTGDYSSPLEWFNGLGVMSEDDLMSLPAQGRLTREKIDEILAITPTSSIESKRSA